MAVVQLAPRVLLHDVGAPPDVVPPGTIVLPQLESRAFGDGSHPTTRLCARAVDLVCRQRAPKAVLDVGTGSGVLARLARMHGVPLVIGTDIAPLALEAATKNAALDDAPGELRIESAPPDAWGAVFDLVIANILEEVLLALAGSLVAALAPGGRLLLSGFTPLQAPSLRTAFGSRGLVPEVQAQLEGWALLQLRRSA